MFRRPHYIALGIVVCLVLVVLSLPSQTAAQLKLALGSLFLPLLGLASSTEHFSERAGDALVPRSVLLKELNQLRSENQQLRMQSMQSTQVFQENAQLRRAVGWQQQSPWQPKLAKVVLRDPASWWRTVHINLGRRDGIITNMPVLTVEGLVGKVHQIGVTTTQVALVGDPNCPVSALVKGTSDSGVIMAETSGLWDRSVVRLAYLSRQSTVKIGDEVITSGLGGVFPKGIPIGHVIEIYSVGIGLNTEARVKLSANLAHLEEVGVLFQ
jgi:rod shape-determining protein MreC